MSTTADTTPATSTALIRLLNAADAQRKRAFVVAVHDAFATLTDAESIRLLAVLQETAEALGRQAMTSDTEAHRPQIRVGSDDFIDGLALLCGLLCALGQQVYGADTWAAFRRDELTLADLDVELSALDPGADMADD